MGKLDDLRRSALGNIDESMGGGRTAPAIHGASPPGPRPVSARLQGIVRSVNAAEIPLDRIAPDPDQPREEFEPEALDRLAESLKTKGQLQPIRVRWDEGRGLYVIVAGERRWRAATMAGLKSLACVIADAPAEPGELLALQLIENCVREDLRPIEQAKAFRALMDLNGWSGNQVAKVLGIAQPNVVRALALLDLPAPVQDRVERGELAPSAAYEVSKLEDPDVQAEVATMAVASGMNRAEVVQAVRAHADRSSTRPKGKGGKPKRMTQRSFRVATGGKVTIENKRGLDTPLIRAMLLEAVALLDAAEDRGADAA